MKGNRKLRASKSLTLTALSVLVEGSNRSIISMSIWLTLGLATNKFVIISFNTLLRLLYYNVSEKLYDMSLLWYTTYIIPNHLVNDIYPSELSS